ncbi:Hypothetical protein HVR_LOCUS448, partial [uncultured virus]
VFLNDRDPIIPSINIIIAEPMNNVNWMGDRGPNERNRKVIINKIGPPIVISVTPPPIIIFVHVSSTRHTILKSSSFNLKDNGTDIYIHLAHKPLLGSNSSSSIEDSLWISLLIDEK